MNTIYLSIKLLVIRDTFGQFINHMQPGYMPHPQRQYLYDHRRGGQSFHRRSGGRYPGYSAESNYDYGISNCKCSCRYCENIKPCCIPVCSNCNSQSLVFVPYPVPLVITIPPTTPTVTTAATITETTTESTTRRFEETASTQTYERSKKQPEDYDYMSTLPAFHKKKLFLTKKSCLRGQRPNHRRMDLIDALLNDGSGSSDDSVANPRRNHQRYGIIPIPDKMALEFMTNMRDMKLDELLQPKIH